MRFVTAREANQGFSQLLKQAEIGESIVITRSGRPVAMLTPYPAAAPQSGRGRSSISLD
jgi:prevent-host-death family protein